MTPLKPSKSPKPGLVRRIRNILVNIMVVTLPTLAVMLILLEIFFRTIIPASDPPSYIFDEAEQLVRLCNLRPAGLHTMGSRGEITSKWRINNYGWNHPVDYQPRSRSISVAEAEADADSNADSAVASDSAAAAAAIATAAAQTPAQTGLIAVIGDSFIEGLHVDNDRKYPFLLDQLLGPDWQVYSFGISSAPMSEYLNLSRYVNRHFDPDILIINLCSNDFDASNAALISNTPFFLQYKLDSNGEIIETIPAPPPRGYIDFYKGWLFKSATVRYFWFNRGLLYTYYHYYHQRWYSDSDGWGNLEELLLNQGLLTSRQIADYTVRTLKAENPQRRIIFVFDAPRPGIYTDDDLSADREIWKNELMATVTERYNLEYLDLTEAMRSDYQKNGQIFDFGAIDGHWNNYGHQFVADLLSDYLKSSLN